MSSSLDFRSMLGSLLEGGRELAQKGEDFVATQLDVGADEQSRSNLRKGMLGGAAGAGVLALLMGSSTARRIGGTGIALGGLAALGKMAYDHWQDDAPGAVDARAPVHDLQGEAADARAHVLLRAMIAAAMADGHLDADERATIEEKLAPLGGEAAGFLTSEIDAQAGPEDIAALGTDLQSRTEIYAVSALICGHPETAERGYLDRLGAALGLDEAACRDIETGLRGIG